MHKDASTTPAWSRLAALAASPHPSIAALFAAEPDRTRRFIAEGGGLVLDFTRQRVSSEVLGTLAQLAEEIGLRGRTAAMYRGDILNPTEKRQVLHTALRRDGA